MNEGQQVTYIGPQTEGLTAGDEGRLLAFASASSAHVQWMTGAQHGDVTLQDLEDLTTGHPRTASQDLLEDSLEVGGLSTQSVLDTFASGGEAGLLNAMADSGHLAAFSDIAEEALGLVATRIRQDPSFREVAAHLDEEDGERLIRLASVCLIRDAFGADDEA